MARLYGDETDAGLRGTSSDVRSPTVPDTMRQVWIPKAGTPDVLELRTTSAPRPAAGEVRVRVEAAGVNFADVMGRLGLYPDLPPMPCVVGYEVAGRVDEVGKGVSGEWVGRDVVAVTRFGGYSELVCVPEVRVMARPPGMGAEDGAALPVNYMTAYELIEVMGALKAGDTVLVHSAGGGVGIAATQIAKRLGATVLGTASQRKHAFLHRLGVDHCIDYTAEDFEPRVRELTGGRGVELALDPIGGKSFRKSYRVLAPTGRLGMFGFAAAVTRPRRNPVGALKAALQAPWLGFSPWSLMSDNRGVFGVNIGHLWDETDRVRGWLEHVARYYEEGSVKPVIAARFPFARAAEAHAYLQQRKNIGKVLLHP